MKLRYRLLESGLNLDVLSLVFLYPEVSTIDLMEMMQEALHVPYHRLIYLLRNLRKDGYINYEYSTIPGKKGRVLRYQITNEGEVLLGDALDVFRSSLGRLKGKHP